MKAKRRVEVFSSDCPICSEAVGLVHRLACDAREVSVLDMHDPRVAKRAKELGVRSIPAVAINGRLAECCAGRGLNESALRAAGLGQSAA
ncbi:MAG: glutaredoxin domain-containing protein [Mariprofundaceae bacterium]